MSLEPQPPNLKSRLSVDLRELPAMRVAILPYKGPASEIQMAIDDLTAFVSTEGIGPAGPMEIHFQTLPKKGNTEEGSIDALLRLPITRLVEDGRLQTKRVPSQKAACVLVSQALDERFLEVHRDLFAWLDQRGLNRMGEQHHHVYLGHNPALNHWTIELRVLLPRRA